MVFLISIKLNKMTFNSSILNLVQSSFSLEKWWYVNTTSSSRVLTSCYVPLSTNSRFSINIMFVNTTQVLFRDS